MENCIFCDIVQGIAEATFIYRDDAISIFMDIQPINPGHVLIIPNQHATYLSDLDPTIGAYMFGFAQKMVKAIRESGLPCDGVNLFLADGEAAGQEIFHVHLHVFPRQKGDGLGLKVGEYYHIKPSREDLESTARLIVRAIK